MDRRSLRQAVTIVVLFVTGTIGWSSFPQAAQAQTSVNLDIGFFYDRLAPYGDWREHARYGWVWFPHDMPLDWRPYTLGQWVYTDDYGWLWDSDEDWGWTCFHYGRWDWDDNLGWFWVPGYDWGPAWVAWRTSPEFIGWCPLPPEVGWQTGVGLELHGFDLDVLPARRFVFVPVEFFAVPRLREHTVLVSRNVTIIRETRNVTRFEIIDGRIFDRGVSLTRIEQVTGRPVRHLRVVHVDTAGAMLLPHERDGEIHVFDPRIRSGRASLTPPRPGELTRRLEAERAQTEERQRAEVARQQQQQQAERAAPDVRPEQLQRRQQAEEQALRGEHERQFRQLENRQSRARGEFARPGGGVAARGGAQPGRAR